MRSKIASSRIAGNRCSSISMQLQQCLSDSQSIGQRRGRVISAWTFMCSVTKLKEHGREICEPVRGVRHSGFSGKTSCICPIWAVPRCNSKRKEIGKASCFFKQTFIFAQSSLGSSWLGSICNHTHIPITCPLAPHLSEQLSRGAATQVDPGEELQVPGSKWGKQLGSAAQPPRTQTPPCCSRLSRGENQ